MATIVLIRGKAGTGKSTVARALARRNRFNVLHKDDLYDSVAEFVPEHARRNQICFAFLYRFLQGVIESNSPVLLDFGFNHADDVKKLEHWVAERGGALKAVRCICSDEAIWSERLSSRSRNPLPNQLITDLTKLKEHYSDIKNEDYENEFVIDTVLDVESNVHRILSYMNGFRRGSEPCEW
ncbi:AAA family ATPase [Paenibacillus methanolicus]|uniref:Putative kinase n=1 Tax=Paenibacillus methanolicus TaxID=582686 RepID=A0A5S5BXP9_9BACL|nr:AAA family ATPase [Paenibacillus methanolicus]TYP71945.1 putative kinase [Paenibacillus methanolicus]